MDDKKWKTHQPFQSSDWKYYTGHIRFQCYCIKFEIIDTKQCFGVQRWRTVWSVDLAEIWNTYVTLSSVQHILKMTLPKIKSFENSVRVPVFEKKKNNNICAAVIMVFAWIWTKWASELKIKRRKISKMLSWAWGTWYTNGLAIDVPAISQNRFRIERHGTRAMTDCSRQKVWWDKRMEKTDRKRTAYPLYISDWKTECGTC